MNKKKLVLIITAFVVLVAALVTAYFLTRPQGTTDEKTFSLTVVHGDGTSSDFTITSSQEFLSLALIDEKIILAEEGLESGMYLTVDGEIADWDADQAYWAFYIGADYANYGMNDTPIENGGAYKLEYTVSDYGG